MELRYLLKGLLLPPFAQIIILFAAWRIRHRMPRLAAVGYFMAIFSLWVLGTPVAATFLSQTLENNPPLNPLNLSTIEADAIVILSAGQNETAPQYGQPVSGQEQLSRIRYGAFVQRRTGLPILVSGGSVREGEQRSLAETMAYDLTESFSVDVRWLETKSRTTAENAELSYEILAAENKLSIILVTSSPHMMRAKWSFEQSGFEVLPAPTGFTQSGTLIINSFLPNAHSLRVSSQALHEWLGFATYQLLERG